MAAGPTYVPIASQTLSSAVSTVSFTSFSGYNDLVLVISCGVTAGTPNIFVQFNSDTGGNYSYNYLQGNGSLASGNWTTNSTSIRINTSGLPNTTLGNTMSIININNYADANTYKSLLVRSNNASSGADLMVGSWRNTAAITRIDLSTSASTFLVGSTFTLYGITAA